jgi:lipopolysaccharide/colanic/teichoic acid biosynthesis glycosyltransferase
VTKRALDLLVAGAALAVASPLFVALAIALRATGHPAVFFRQERIGRALRRFPLVKMRRAPVRRR